MDFREFNKNAEIPIQIAILEVLMQPKFRFSLRDKMYQIGKVIQLYNKTYKEITGKNIMVNELVEVLRDCDGKY